ncbi:hypothetical protein [Gordonia sp. KTR9]|uniref:hypothetical protein n=1 Tax=Gordonia sp. KTR9 TaxID=337191 RepID=UPI00130DA7D9|nr:hypothetical protein [Gordonia sp. KTR9]
MGTSSWLGGLGTPITKPGAGPPNNWLISQYHGADRWTLTRDGPMESARPAQTVVGGA